jgi:hypothetical protein
MASVLSICPLPLQLPQTTQTSPFPLHSPQLTCPVAEQFEQFLISLFPNLLHFNSLSVNLFCGSFSQSSSEFSGIGCPLNGS